MPGATTANTTVPSAPPRTQRGQNLPSILRSSSPPAYWTQRLRGGSGSQNHNTAPSAPAWGDHLPSVREEQPPTQPYSNLGMCVSNCVRCEACTQAMHPFTHIALSCMTHGNHRKSSFIIMLCNIITLAW